MLKIYLLLVILQLSYSSPAVDRKVEFLLGRGPRAKVSKTSEVSRPKRQTPEVDTRDRDVPPAENPQDIEPDAERQRFPIDVNEHFTTRGPEESDLLSSPTANVDPGSELSPENFPRTPATNLLVDKSLAMKTSEFLSTSSQNLSDIIPSISTFISLLFSQSLADSTTTPSTQTEKQNFYSESFDSANFSTIYSLSLDSSTEHAHSKNNFNSDSLALTSTVNDSTSLGTTIFSKISVSEKSTFSPFTYSSIIPNDSESASTLFTKDMFVSYTSDLSSIPIYIPQRITAPPSIIPTETTTDLQSLTTQPTEITTKASDADLPTMSIDINSNTETTLTSTFLINDTNTNSLLLPVTISINIHPNSSEITFPDMINHTTDPALPFSSTPPYLPTLNENMHNSSHSISTLTISTESTVTTSLPKESFTTSETKIIMPTFPSTSILTFSFEEDSETKVPSTGKTSSSASFPTTFATSTKSLINDVSHASTIEIFNTTVQHTDFLMTTKSTDVTSAVRPLSTLTISTESETSTISNEIIPPTLMPTNVDNDEEDVETQPPSLLTSTTTAPKTTDEEKIGENIITPPPPPPPETSSTTIPETNQVISTAAPQSPPPTTQSQPEITTVDPEEAEAIPSVARPLYPYSLAAASNASNENSSKLTEQANCVFGRGFNLEVCEWRNLNISLEKWIATKGQNYGWLGGPPVDHTSFADDGGYAMYETSRLVDNQFAQTLAFDSAMLLSPILRRTEAVGMCIDFWYSMDGLSQDRVRILLRPPPAHLYAPGANPNVTNEKLDELFMNSDGRDDIVLWEHKDTTNGEWINGQVVYAFNDRHMVIFEGLPVSISDPNRAYRGYISVDDFIFRQATDCKPFCNFEGGFCSWTQDIADDFDWDLSRGSVNPSTGPPMDRFSFNYGIKGGGYAFINSGFPRRPRDRSRLLSEVFSPPAPDQPLCMRFWTHMFGSGIGALRIILVPSRGIEEVIWELRGEQGNNWYQGQVTISSIADFQIAIEAVVGDNNFGDIAIDEIALKENACPTSPQTASRIKGDCTFEVDECGWRNVEFRQRMDELDWERIIATDNRVPAKDHTLKTSQGSFMSLPRTTVQRGERGWLMSPSIEPLNQDTINTGPVNTGTRTRLPENAICLSFWYFMYDPLIGPTGPSLGSLRVMLMEQDQQGFQRLTPLWGLKNNQGPNWQYGQLSINSNRQFMILFEGLWGNTRGGEILALDDITFFKGDCTTLPPRAQVSFLDCDFTRDSCAYVNGSAGIDRWYTTSLARRPSTLPDHTYGGPVGYLFFDVFNTQAVRPKVILMSRAIERSEDRLPACLTFWFAPIGNDQDTRLTVQRESVDIITSDPDATQTGSAEIIWDVSARDVYQDRLEWMFGQVQISTSTDYKISFVGEARKGGYALDDIQVLPGQCLTRPLIIRRPEDENRNTNVVGGK